MRILMLSSGLPPEVLGGAESQCRKLSEELGSTGHFVTVLTSTQLFRARGEQIEKGVRLFRFFSPSPPQKLGRRVASTVLWSFQVALWWRRNGSNFDVIHCHQAKYPAALAVWLNSGRLPIIAKLGDGGHKFDLATLRRKRFFGRLLERTVRDGVSTFVAITGQIGDDLLAAGVKPARIVAIPNGVSTATTPDEAQRDSARASLRVDSECSVVLYCGRFSTEKNLEAALSAWRSSVCSPQWRLMMVGAGPAEQRLREIASDDPTIRILPRVDDISLHLAATDFVLLPSTAEGLSNFVLEAFSAGRPALVTPTGGNTDLVTDGVNGLVATDTSAEALRDLFERCFSLDRSTVDQLSHEARRSAIEQYSLPLVATRYSELYSSLI